jgi:hypothetical protein
MKRLWIIGLVLLTVNGLVLAQKNPVDELFDRYSGVEGFTSIYISGRMLSLFSGLTQEDKELSEMVSRLTSIRILSADDFAVNRTVNLYDEMAKRGEFKKYEELMVVKEGQDIIKFMILESGTRIAELLVVSGGTSNSIISIRGDINLKNISDLSKRMGIEQLENLEKIEKKQDIRK